MDLQKKIIPILAVSLLLAGGVFTYSYFSSKSFPNKKAPPLSAPTHQDTSREQNKNENVESTNNVDTSSALFHIDDSKNEKTKKKSHFLPFTEQVKLRDEYLERNRLKVPILVGQRYRFARNDKSDTLFVTSPNSHYNFTITTASSETDYKTLIDPITRTYKLIPGDERELTVTHPDKNVKILDAFVFDEADFSHVFVFAVHPWTRRLVIMQFYSTNFTKKTEKTMNLIFQALKFT